MGEAAVAAARAVGYVGAGTVEFIVNQDGSFYFMEMNTRLQVEHPVTEMITGTDLVEWQLRVASGEPLPLQQSQLTIHGHAIEARVYAENPEKGFLPSIGTLLHMRTPAAVNFELGGKPDPAGCRIDSGVREGDTISPYYDPMIAKLIVWGKDRDEALARMAQALAQYQLVGLSSNIAFLQRLIYSKAFSGADLDTGLIERNHTELFPAPAKVSLQVLALAAVRIILSERHSNENDPFDSSHGWRMNSHLVRSFSFEHEGENSVVSVRYLANGWTISADSSHAPILLKRAQGDDIDLQIGTESVTAAVVRHGEHFHIFSRGQHHELIYTDPLAHAGEAEAETGRLTAPMPGKIVALLVKSGQSVKKGEPLLIMEAMKMEHTIAAPKDGVVKELMYLIGDQVSDGAQLLIFE
jgi:3-methylcrotonyl-CoA carboxylase alpha subunit